MDLNTILIILGVIALIGLVAHGIWSNRREKSQLFNNSKFDRQNANNMQEPEPIKPQQNIPNFAQVPTTSQPQFEQRDAQNLETFEVESQMAQAEQEKYVYTPAATPTRVVNSVDEIKITLPEMAQTEKPSASVFYEYKATPKAMAENVLERTLDEVTEFSNTEEGIHISSAQVNVQLQDIHQGLVSPISTPKLQQPVENVVLQESQQSFNFERGEKNAGISKFFLLYVVSPENRRFSGVSLSQTLDHLGFVFGKNSQYHRHVDSVASPIIFSVANIEQSGVFNPYMMHDFSTVGVVLFMEVPSSVGNDKANLKMMIKAAKNIAQELSGFVLTDQEEIFDEAAEQRYLAQL